MKLTSSELKALEWGNENIKFVGTSNTNKWKTRYSNHYKRAFTPTTIVDHISEGTMSSLIDWFTSKGNTGSSSHFGISKKGEVVQFVKIEDRAWCNGLIKDPSADMIHQVGLDINPNQYTISIEHEGRYRETKGALTAEQLEASIKTHAYIIAYVKKHFNFEIPVNRKHIIGHYEIDAINKINCPGKDFQWFELVQEVQILLNQNTLLDIEGHWGEEFMKRAVKLGLVEGYGGKYMKPDKQMTRAEAITLAVKTYDKVINDLVTIIKDSLNDLQS